MSYNYLYKCNDCDFRWKDISPTESRGFIRCIRCESKNVECLTDKKYHGLKLEWWLWLLVSTISSIIVGSVLTYLYITAFDRALWWVIPVGFFGGFFLIPILNAIFWILEEIFDL